LTGVTCSAVRVSGPWMERVSSAVRPPGPGIGAEGAGPTGSWVWEGFEALRQATGAERTGSKRSRRGNRAMSVSWFPRQNEGGLAFGSTGSSGSSSTSRGETRRGPPGEDSVSGERRGRTIRHPAEDPGKVGPEPAPCPEIDAGECVGSPIPSGVPPEGCSDPGGQGVQGGNRGPMRQGSGG